MHPKFDPESEHARIVPEHCMDQYQSEPVRLKQIVRTFNTDGGLVAITDIIFSMTCNYRLCMHIDIIDQ
jgi:hypothetical protein